MSILAMLFITSIYAREINEVNGFKNPESVLAYKDHLFVTNMGEKLEPTAKEGNGYISMLSRKDGKVEEIKFISGLNAPKGMFIRRGVLYVADVDKIKGFDIKTKKKVFETSLANYGVTYANDIARAHRGMYVSSTLNNSIYKVKYNGKVEKMKVKGEQLTGVNGLYRGRVGKLAVANYGRNNEPNGSFGKIGIVTKKYKEYTKFGTYDGIVRKNGKLFVSDWVNNNNPDEGRVLMYRNNIKKGFYEVHLAQSVNGPSDIYIDRRTRLLWIPAMLDDKLVAVPFEDLRKKAS